MDNLPKYVLFSPEYVGWKGLPFAIKDALNMGVPLAVYEQHKAQVEEYILKNNLDVKTVVIDLMDIKTRND